MNVPAMVKLPLRFDAEALAREALSLAASAWVPHFNQQIYEGAWTGVALRSIGGLETQLYPDPAAQQPFADTPALSKLPNHKAALGELRCPLLAARLLSLAPGAVIKEHSDYLLGYDDGELRIHIPVVTSPDVEFALAGRPVVMAPGEAWYLNLNLPHRVANRSAITRIHLVVDCVVDEWLTALLERALAR
jgi:hypothetical protein